MFMSQRRTRIALCAAALSAVLLLPDVSSAQFRGLGGGLLGGGLGNYGGLNTGGWYGGWGGYPGNYAAGWGGNYGNWGGNYIMPGYGYNTYSNPQPYNYSSPIFYGNYYPGTVGVSQSYYPPMGQMQGATSANRAFIDVRVPANAQVFFDGSPTQQRGMERQFMTPPLERGSHYTYRVKAQWMQDGKKREATKTVQLTPGQTSNVNFLEPQNAHEAQTGQQQSQQRQQPQQQQPQQRQPQQRQPQTPPRNLPPDR